MGLPVFRRRRKPRDKAMKKEAEADAAARNKAQGVTDQRQQPPARRKRMTKPPVRTRSKDFSSPLLTINEAPSNDTEDSAVAPPGTDVTKTVTPAASVLSSLNVVTPATYETDRSGLVSGEEGGMEVVMSGAPNTGATAENTYYDTKEEEAEHPPSFDVTKEEKLVVEEATKEYTPTEEEEEARHEEVRKILFDDEEQRAAATQPTAQEPKTITPVKDEDPFDIVAEFESDEMIDLDKASGGVRQHRADMLQSDVTRRLLDAFNCDKDTTQSAILKKHRTKPPAVMMCVSDMFYDSMCGAYVDGRKRPYYNEEFTLQFLSEVTKDGIPLLYHQPPSDPKSDWTGRSVDMFVKPGNCHGTKLVQPKLEWSTLGGGWSRTGTSEVTTTSIDLLSIQSILDSTINDEDDIRDDDGPQDDMCFFSITTNKGDVYIFESRTFEERDRLVNGLKNVTARLAYHLVAGDVAVSSELYNEDYGQTSGDLPTLRPPAQAMNDISHSFLG